MKPNLTAVILVLSVTTVTLAEFNLKALKLELTQFLKDGTTSEDFMDTLEAVTLKNPIKGFRPKVEIGLLKGVEGQPRIDLTCILCNNVAETVLGWVEAGASREELVNQTTALCANTGFAKENVCRGMVEAYVDMFMWIIEEKETMGDPITPNDCCGLALYPDCPLKNPQYNWTLDLDFLGPKPPGTDMPLPPASPRVRVLQFTDVHVDPNYTPGGNALCDEPTCCRLDQGPPETPEGAAGFWGDYRDCDLPVHTYRELISHAQTTHSDVAYVIFTGDIIDHGVWATSEQYNRNLFTSVTAEMREAFPGVPLLPVIGNHEPHPLNVFSSGYWDVPDNVSQKWFYEMASTTWGEWLGPEIETTITLGGYYKYQLTPELLIVVVNNNVGDTYNWWLMYDSRDPGGQLMWLAQTLLEAEQAGMKVHILSHMNADSGFDPWNRDYRRIIDRFENIITAQFFGHTHDDLFEVHYSLEDISRPNMVAFSGGSGTTYSDNNPNYKVYTLEGEHPGSNFQVIDVESWYFNLTQANLDGPFVRPTWEKLYSFNEAYGVTSMRPVDLDHLVVRMVNDTDLQYQYFTYAVKAADSALAAGCDDDCLRDYICDIVGSNPGKCDELPWPAP